MKQNSASATLAFLCTLWATTPLAAEPATEIIARYGSEFTVTTADLTAMLQALPAQYRGEARLRPKAVTQLLETVLLNRALSAQARKLGLDRSPEVAAELRQAEEKILANRRLEAFEASIAVPDYTQAAREQYEVNKAKFVDPEQVQAAHVLIPFPRERTEAEALKLAEDVRAKALAGADFGELAKEYSSDPGSRAKGGDVGYFGRGRMVKPFEEAAFALTTVGQISAPVKSPFGYHIIKLLARQPVRQKSFEEVKDAIIAPMRANLISTERAAFTAKITNSPELKIDTGALDRLLGAQSTAPGAGEPPSKKP